LNNIRKQNQGFSLIELLISMALLSIVMVMVVTFMGSSQAAYRKTKSNLNLQTEAMQVMEQMSDTMMQASYIRIATKDKGMYYINKEEPSSTNKRTVTEVKDTDYHAIEDYDFVPDNYGNYALNCDLTEDSREVIVDFDNADMSLRYRLVDRSDKAYPLDSDKDLITGTGVRSFRALRPMINVSGIEVADDYRYIKPEFIYLEYLDSANVQKVSKEKKDEHGNVVKDDAGNPVFEDVYEYGLYHVIYYITDITSERNDTCSIYMYRKRTDPGDYTENYKTMKEHILKDMLGYSSADKAKQEKSYTAFTTEEESITTSDVEGLVTNKISDFYVSADSDGNSLLCNILFKDSGYEYNSVESVNFRNSSVLTVRPQKLYKRMDKSTGGGTTPSGGGTTPSGGGTTPSGGETTPSGGGTTPSGGGTTPSGGGTTPSGGESN